MDRWQLVASRAYNHLLQTCSFTVVTGKLTAIIRRRLAFEERVLSLSDALKQQHPLHPRQMANIDLLFKA